MTHVIKLTGAKESSPVLSLIKDGQRKPIANTIKVKTTGIFF